MNRTKQHSNQTQGNKEPWLAVNLSKLLPGLGQIYAGKILKGCILLFINLSSLFLGIGLAIHRQSFPSGIVIFIVGTIVLPIWNLFDAYQSVQRQNSREFEAERRQSPDAWLAVFLSSFIPGAGLAYLRQWLLFVTLIVLSITTFLGAWSPYPAIAIGSSLAGWAVGFLSMYTAYIYAPIRRDRSQRMVFLFIAGLFVLPILLTIALAVAIRSFMIETRYIPAGSMLPTLQINDRLIIDKLVYRYSDPQRGDIVIFNPTAQLQKQNYKDPFVKRIIGIPGDRVEVKAGKVFINGKAIEENYLEEPPAYTWSSNALTPDGRVPPGEYLVFGDNRNNSYDSHFWGSVPRENIIGKAACRFYPFERMGFIGDR